MKGSFFAVILLLTCLICAAAWADVTIDAVSFPDEAFRHVVSEIWDTDGDGVLSDAEAASVVTLGVSERGISSLKGIEHFPSLAYLYCSSNQLTELDVSKCPELIYLDCHENQLMSLDVSGCTKLGQLFCYSNQLTSLDVSSCSELWELKCYSNHLAGLDVSNCAPNIESYLSCYDNVYTIQSPCDLSTLPGNFDVSRVRYWEGATVQGTVLTATSHTVVYYYQVKEGSNGSYGFQFNLEGDISGTCGENVSFTLTDDGLLTISGTGAMADFGYEQHWQEVKEIIIEDGVTSLGACAFNNCSNITHVTIPNSVTSIGDSAFRLCRSLNELTIPESVTSIGYSAFMYCSNLQNIIIPDGMDRIGASTFYYCTGLTSITIPVSVTSIEDNAFGSCTALTDVFYTGKAEEWTAITLGEENGPLVSATIHGSEGIITDRPEMSGTCGNYPDQLSWTLHGDGGLVISGSGAMQNYDGVDWIPPWNGINYLNSVTVENGVTTIGSGAFRNCKSLSQVTIPGSVTRIGGSAFWGCTNLSQITIPESVIRIGGNAFSGCNLSEITLSANIAEIEPGAFADNPNLMTIRVDPENPVYSSVNGALLNRDQTVLLSCPGGLSSFTIPESVETIEQYAFSGCHQLTQITLPEKVTSIGSNAFSGCSRLQSVTMSNKVNRIDYYAFEDCSSLTDLYFAGSEEDWAGVTIESGNDALNGISVHFNSENAGPAVASSGTCGENLTWKLYSDGVLSISGTGEMTSHPWTHSDIREVAFGEGITGICSNAFSECVNLEKVTLPDSIISIGSGAFEGCLNLKGIKLPSGLTRIENSAFAGSGLTGITIPDGVVSIGEHAFNGCADLNTVTIPESVTSIEDGAFQSCDTLTDVLFTGSGEKWAQVAMGSNNEKLTGANVQYDYAYVVKSGLYGSLTWKQYNNGLLVISGTGPARPEYDWMGSPWYQSPEIRSVVLEEGVSGLFGMNFTGCANLKSITIPVSMVHMESSFSGCTSLSDVYYAGSRAQWAAMTRYNDFNGATVHFGITQDPVAIDASIFPDELFRTYVSTQFDTDQDGLLSEEETDNVKTIEIRNAGMTSLQGIEFFWALTSLDCGSNQLTDLDVSRNTALTTLDCSSNQLTVLDLSSNRALTNLTCSSNHLTSLDVRESWYLDDLDCSGNTAAITSPLDLTTLPGSFDVSRTSNWTGGSVSGTILTATADTVTYDYDCGNGNTVTFTLTVQSTALEPELVAYSGNEVNFYIGLDFDAQKTVFSSSNLMGVDVSNASEMIDAYGDTLTWDVTQLSGTGLDYAWEATAWDTSRGMYGYLKTMPSQPMDAVFEVSCEWGGTTKSVSVTAHFIQLNQLPTGISGIPAVVNTYVGETIPFEAQIEPAGWSLPGYSAQEFFEGTEDFASGEKTLTMKAAGDYEAAYVIQVDTITLAQYVTFHVAAHPEWNISLPAELKEIQEEAFAGTTDSLYVLVNDLCTVIGDRAFAGSGLKAVYIPASVHSIATDAFPNGTVIYTPAGSYAEGWANDNGFRTVPYTKN